MVDETQQPQQSETVPIDDLDSFVRILVDWHSGQVAMLKHFLEIPEGNEMEIQMVGQEAQTITLSGDMLTGFKAGIEMALAQLGELPFVAETDSPNLPDAANDEPAPGN